MGRVLCWQLIQSGHQVAVFDKDSFGFPESPGSPDVPCSLGSKNAAAHTAAGMLTPYAELESAETLIFELGMKSLDIWPKIIDSLSIVNSAKVTEYSNLKASYFSQGSLVIAHANDRADYQRFKRHVGSKLSADILTKAELDRIALEKLEPELPDHFQQALYFPEECWLQTKPIMDALYQCSIKLGSQWHANSEVIQIKPQQIETKQGKFNFDLVIDCRGLGAKPDMPSLRGVRGELIWLQASDVRINRLIRLMHPRYNLYIAPQNHDDLYIVGATQLESDDRGDITVRSMLELLSAAYSVHSGFAEARVMETRVNCRPALADNLPKIQTQEGLVRINGLFRHGYLLAPSLADEICQLLEPGINTDQKPIKTTFSALIENSL